jgi:hypothetical protein
MNIINNIRNNMPSVGTVAGEAGSFGFSVGCTVLAASALGGPVGLTGAVVFGVTEYLAGRSIECVISNDTVSSKVLSIPVLSKILGVANKIPFAKKIAIYALSLFSAMGVLALMGTKITFIASLVLSITSGLVAFGVVALALLILGTAGILGIALAMKAYSNLQQHAVRQLGMQMTPS